MVRHIVSFNFKPEIEPAQRALVGGQLEAMGKTLAEKIPCLLNFVIVVPPLATSSSDIALYSEVDLLENLDVYQNHPEHQKMVVIIRQHCCDRHCIDMMG